MKEKQQVKASLSAVTHLVSSPSMIKEFRRNYVWEDIQTILRQSIENNRDELETMGAGTGYPAEEIPYALAFYQGAIYMARLVLDIPETLSTLTSEKEEEANDSAEL